MSDDPVAVCPECGEAATRMISGGWTFKGDGFYITDYRLTTTKRRSLQRSRVLTEGRRHLVPPRILPGQGLHPRTPVGPRHLRRTPDMDNDLIRKELEVVLNELGPGWIDNPRAPSRPVSR